MVQFYPFLLHIALDETGSLTIEAQFMGLIRSHIMSWDDLPLEELDLEKSGLWFEHGFIDSQKAYELGRNLAEILFQGDVRLLLEETVCYLKEDEGLRLMLQFPSLAGIPPESDQHDRVSQLRSLPWELMHGLSGKHGFFTQSREVTLARHDSQANLPNHPPDSAQSLRVLIIDAAETGAVPLRKKEEIEAVRRAMNRVGGLRHQLNIAYRHLRNQGDIRQLPARLWNVRRFSITVLSRATRASVTRAVKLARADKRPFHVIHFIGHGESDATSSYLFLNGPEGENAIDRTEANDFINLIANPDLSLLVINACESAAVGNHVDNAAHIALMRGIPVVIGMRIKVFDKASVYLARDFYTALASGEPVETALSSARMLTVRETSGMEIDWAIPLLYMGWSEGLTFPRMKWKQFGLVKTLIALFMAFITILGISSTLMSAPEQGVKFATTVPGVKCLALHDMDENKFTVAFYNFAVVDENGNMVITDDGRDLAQFLYNRFEHNFTHMGLGIPYELRPPKHTCAIYGKDEKTRADRAARIARAINADVIIYGTIINARSDPRLKIDFHVSSEGFDEGDEILGTHALGGLLKVDRPFNPEDLLFIYRPAHIVRTDILNQVIFGLSYFSVDNYVLAAHFFRKAVETEEWPDSDGKEVVYLLLGNAVLRQSAQVNSLALLDEAESHYKKAQSIAPDHIRAQLGLASVLQSRAVGDMKDVNPQAYDESLLKEAEELYLDALEMAKQSDDNGKDGVDYDQVQTTVEFALGQIAYNRWLRDFGDHYKDASKHLKAVIEAHNSGLSYQPYRAGRAYGYLAHIERQRPSRGRAVEYYEKAIELSSPFYQSYYSCRLSQLYCLQAEDAQASKTLQAAIDTARLYGHSSLVDYFTPRLDQLKSSGCYEYECPTVLSDD